MAESPKATNTAPATFHIAKTQVNRKFQYRRQVQCRMCKTFGHDTDEDVCRIGAQIHHAIKYQAQEPEIAKKNANAYAMANKKSTIQMVCTDCVEGDDVQPDEHEVMKAEQLAMKFMDPGQE